MYNSAESTLLSRSCMSLEKDLGNDIVQIMSHGASSMDTLAMHQNDLAASPSREEQN